MLKQIMTKIGNVSKQLSQGAWARRRGGLAAGFVALCLAPGVAFAGYPYCLAIRGNGDAQPAHWGALASVVEKLGLPHSQAGGSSATISMLMIDAIAQNPWLRKQSGPIRNRRAALMLKSLSGIAAYLMDRPQVQAGLWLYRSLPTQERLELLLQLKNEIPTGEIERLSERAPALQALAQDLMALGVGSHSRYAGVLHVLRSPELLNKMSSLSRKRAAFYAEELYRAMSAMGSFDAESDPDLFFRDGVIDFEKLALGIGRVATFFAQRVPSAKVMNSFQRFLNSCEDEHVGLTWEQIVQKRPYCEKFLNESLEHYFNVPERDLNQFNIVRYPPGRFTGRRQLFGVDTFATTTVLLGQANADARNAYSDYHSGLDRSQSQKFIVKSPHTDIKFGYWGPEDRLPNVQNAIGLSFELDPGGVFDFRTDAKSERFLALGQTTWLDILSLSPAEPGLASLQPMEIGEEEAMSAGGWSDLSPTMILRARGCSSVVYVTRRGGESLFAQGVAKRLLGLERDWRFLQTQPEQVAKQNQIINANGDRSDMTSLWSRLYNAANPKSSFTHSLRVADAVLCTDWNRFDTKREIPAMIKESYEAPFVMNDKAYYEFVAELREQRANLIFRPNTLPADQASAVAGCFAKPR